MTMTLSYDSEVFLSLVRRVETNELGKNYFECRLGRPRIRGQKFGGHE